MARDSVTRAFQTWAASTQFSFGLISSTRNPELTVIFHRRAHGDGYAFDGRGGVLAHSFAPTDGRFHYDADERWAVDVVTGAYDSLWKLGFGHGSVRGAVMLPTISSGFTRRRLTRDDMSGIKALYNTGSMVITKFTC